MFRNLAIGGALLLGLALPTLADAATVNHSVNIRSGAGTKYAVVAVVRPKTSFSVVKCTRNWCMVTYHGVHGWMCAAYAGSPTKAVVVHKYVPKHLAGRAPIMSSGAGSMSGGSGGGSSSGGGGSPSGGGGCCGHK